MLSAPAVSESFGNYIDPFCQGQRLKYTGTWSVWVECQAIQKSQMARTETHSLRLSLQCMFVDSINTGEGRGGEGGRVTVFFLQVGIKKIVIFGPTQYSRMSVSVRDFHRAFQVSLTFFQVHCSQCRLYSSSLCRPRRSPSIQHRDIWTWTLALFISGGGMKL